MRGRGGHAARAEGGDQILATDVTLTTLKFIDREVAQHGTLKPELDARYTQMEHSGGIVWLNGVASAEGLAAGAYNWSAAPLRPFERVCASCKRAASTASRAVHPADQLASKGRTDNARSAATEPRASTSTSP